MINDEFLNYCARTRACDTSPFHTFVLILSDIRFQLLRPHPRLIHFIRIRVYKISNQKKVHEVKRLPSRSRESDLFDRSIFTTRARFVSFRSVRLVDIFQTTQTYYCTYEYVICSPYIRYCTKIASQN